MTAFFIPGISRDDDGRAVEVAYGEMCRCVELEMGRRPSARRIEMLWTRRGSIDCMTVVGKPDPLRGGTVMAIFDMGSRQPFVVWREADISTEDGRREVLGSSAYSVLEFDT
jgi:hypothetical protein